jgi:hypothetical protein
MPTSRAAWDAWQYHDSSSESGILLVFRLKESPQASQSIEPKAVKAVHEYRWSPVLGDATVKVESQCLLLAMSAPNAVLMHYERK